MNHFFFIIVQSSKLKYLNIFSGDSRQHGPQVQMSRSFWFLHVQELLEEPAQFLFCIPTFKEELSQRSAGTQFYWQFKGFFGYLSLL